MNYELGRAIKKHDSAVDDVGVEIWIGAEPTFTLRSSEDPEWLSQPLGGDKYTYALAMAQELFLQHPGSVILRSVGRQYGGEDVPRWSVGLFERRDGVPVWDGPPDPLIDIESTMEKGKLQGFLELIEQELIRKHWSYKRLPADKSDDLRLVIRSDGKSLEGIDDSDSRLSRPSVHEQKTPHSGLEDPLAAEGYLLFVIGEKEIDHRGKCIRVELPVFERVPEFLECLSVLGSAAKSSELTHLLLQGFPPPVDHSISWTTITPDPAVIEINQAPQPDILHFHQASDELFQVADKLGLSPYRLQYNGTMSDSGGGGQFTVGGRTPQTSPFFVAPRLLPRLVRYFNQHPCLSYLFATDYVGSASQSPRTDEGTRDSFHELVVALDQLERQADPSAEFLWSSLAPFLADPSGNSHRSELNIEKLWNAGLPLRGCLGLLEFRAFRMAHTSQRSVALALLLRAIAAMLARHDMVQELHDWGDDLHDRFALPLFLHQDLLSVLTDLDKCGFGLGPLIQDELRDDPARSSWSTDFGGCRLEIEQAIEFWPLVGDVASQERGGSRLVDSSTSRLQITLRRTDSNAANLSDWILQTGEFSLPLLGVSDESEEVRVIGLRFRDFVPWRGLHPAIEPLGPFSLALSHPEREDALEVVLHGWRADGLPYEGLPDSLQDAAQRRAARLRVKTIPRADIPRAKAPPDVSVNGFTFDLRRL